MEAPSDAHSRVTIKEESTLVIRATCVASAAALAAVLVWIPLHIHAFTFTGIATLLAFGLAIFVFTANAGRDRIANRGRALLAAAVVMPPLMIVLEPGRTGIDLMPELLVAGAVWYFIGMAFGLTFWAWVTRAGSDTKVNVAIDDDTVSVSSAAGDEVVLPRSQVASVRFHPTFFRLLEDGRGRLSFLDENGEPLYEHAVLAWPLVRSERALKRLGIPLHVRLIR